MSWTFPSFSGDYFRFFICCRENPSRKIQGIQNKPVCRQMIQLFSDAECFRRWERNKTNPEIVKGKGVP